MALPSPPTLVTTLNGDVKKDDRSITLTASTNVVDNMVMVIGQEMVRIITANTTSNVHTVRRGIEGTRAVKHLDLTAAYVAVRADFSMVGGRPAVVGYSGSLGEHVKMALPLGALYKDPDTGYEYRLVDCQTSFAIGEWVTIDDRGLALQLIQAAIGRVGIIIDTVSGSDTLAWALVAGVFRNACVSSDVTSATDLAASTSATGYPSFADSDTDVIVHNARATAVVATSVGTSPLVTGVGGNTVLLDHPWINGASDFVS